MVCTDCPIGYACPDAANSENNIQCSKLVGFYGDVINLIKCKICPAGTYCPIDEALPLSCAAGSYSLAGSSACTICPPGYECPSTSLALMNRCKLGTYSTGGL